MDAALSLTNECIADNSDKKADELIFPTVFNADQSIELYLKAIIWELNRLEEKDDDFPTGHDLRQLLNEVKKLISDHCNKEDRQGLKKSLSNVQSYIDELYLLLYPDTKRQPTHKENLDFPRYPVNKGKDPFPYADVTSRNVVVDLENFVNRFSHISSDLEEIYDYFEGQLNWQEENVHNSEKQNGSSALTVRRSASAERSITTEDSAYFYH